LISDAIGTTWRFVATPAGRRVARGERAMYGTVARIVLKPGMGERFIALWHEIDE
jgi:hypothetical protein